MHGTHPGKNFEGYKKKWTRYALYIKNNKYLYI